MPACATLRGTADAKFGIEEEEDSMITQSVKVTHKRDKKELRNSCGGVIAVAYYNRMAEVEVEGTRRGSTGADVGDSYDLANTCNPVVIGKIMIDEVSIDMSNEDFVKTTLKGTAYHKIT